MELNYIALAIPGFFLLIGIELVIAHIQKKQVYRFNDAVNDISCGLLHQVVDLLGRGLILACYTWVYYNWHLFELPSNEPLTWVLAFILVDLCFYTYHRCSHEVNFLWASHLVHHQSEEYNLAVALRQPASEPFLIAPFYWPLALLGFHPVVYLTASSLNLLYQFWIHTQTVGKLGFAEKILMTPSHHRVHHGRNPKYLDRNHGGMFIIWDKLFGTFQVEEEAPVYGITTPLNSFNPIWANVHYWVALLHAAKAIKGWSDRFKLFLNPPGWMPETHGGREVPQEVPADYKKYDPRGLPKLYSYLPLQFLILILVAFFWLLSEHQLTTELLLLGTGFIVLSVVSFGALLDNLPWGRPLEWFRILTIPVFCTLAFGQLGLVSLIYSVTFALHFRWVRK